MPGMKESRLCTHDHAITRPSPIPANAPDVVISRLSSSMLRRTSHREAPSARNRPISRVRSATDIASVFTTPSRLTMIAT